MKALSSLMVASAIALVAIPAAKADDYDKNTKITVNEIVRLPTMTLQPGNYSLRLIEATGNRHVVKVTDENGKGLGLILALPNYRLVPKDRTVLTYWETPPGQPRAVRAWFFPGDNYGQEFIYPKDEASAIAGYTGGTLPDASADLKTAQVQNFDESNSQPPTTVAAAAAPPPAPEPAPAPVAVETPAPVVTEQPQVIAQATPPPAPAQPDTTPAPAATPDQLPQTGSDLPLIGLIGLISLAALVMTMPGKRRRI
jgi:LPXTG-motif cell wall-anchored protein